MLRFLIDSLAEPNDKIWQWQKKNWKVSVEIQLHSINNKDDRNFRYPCGLGKKSANRKYSPRPRKRLGISIIFPSILCCRNIQHQNFGILGLTETCLVSDHLLWLSASFQPMLFGTQKRFWGDRTEENISLWSSRGWGTVACWGSAEGEQTGRCTARNQAARLTDETDK